jgi:hydroxypyruvate isomerase
MSVTRRSFLGSTALLAGAAAGGFAAGDEVSDTKSIGKTPHTKFAVNIEMWFTKIPYAERIKQAAALGFPAVEIWPWQNKDLDAIAAQTQELGIEIAQFTAWGFKPGLNEPKNHDDFVKAIEEGCKAAKKLRCKLMCVVAGDDVPGMTQAQMHENVIKGLKRGAPIAEANDVTLILEPMNIRVDHKGHCLYGSQPAIRICNEVNSPAVKINWDLYHMHITEGDLCGHLREGFAAKRVGYIQLADHPGRHEPGTGEIHYNRVLKELADLGYRGYVGLELSPSKGELAAAIACAKADVW